MNVKNVFEKRRSFSAAAAVFAAAVLLTVAGCDLSAGNEDNGDGDPVQEQGRTTLAIQGTRPAAQTGRTVTRARALGDPIPIDVIGVNGTVTGVITLTEARIVLEEFEFESELEGDDGTEDTEIEYEFEGPYLADLISNEVVPSLETIELPAGTYQEIKFKVHSIDGSEDDETGQTLVEPADPLYGNSIRLGGTYSGLTASGEVTDVPFSMTLDLDESFELKAAGEQAVGFTIDPDTENDVIIAFRLAKWFRFDDPETNPAGVEFASTQPDGGAIALDFEDSGDNGAVVEVIEDNIKASADYGKDDDHDGELESEEDDDPDEEDDEDYEENDNEDDEESGEL